MSVYTFDPGAYLTRSGAYFTPGSSWTWTGWFQFLYDSSAGNFRTFKFFGDPAYVSSTIWLGLDSTGAASRLYIEPFNGTTYFTSLPTTLTPEQWYGIAVVYDSVAHTVSLYLTDDDTSLPTLLDTIAVDLSTFTFAVKTERLLGYDGTGDDGNVGAFDRVFALALTQAQIRVELDAIAAVQSALADTPLTDSNDLADDSGHGHDWTKVDLFGGITFYPVPIQVAWGFGQSIRTSAQWTPSQAQNGPIIFGGINGQLAVQFHLNAWSVTSTAPPSCILTGSNTFRLSYRGNNTDVTVDFTDPWTDPITGLAPYCQPGPLPYILRDTWGWHHIEIKFKTSTYSMITETYAQDGAIELKIDGLVLYTQSGIYIKRTPANPAFTFITVEIYPNGDSDAFWMVQGYDYPTFSGVQRVPSHANLVEYLDFNAGLPVAPPWNPDTIGPTDVPGPLPNPVAGLGGSGGASIWNSDPLVYSGESTSSSSTDYHPGGSLRNSQIVLNILNPPPPPPGGTGTIIVQKIIVPPDATIFAFTAGGGLTPSTFNLGHAGTQTYINVPAGSGYSIIETPNALYTTTYVVSNGSPYFNLTVGVGETVLVTVTNTFAGPPPPPDAPGDGCPTTDWGVGAASDDACVAEGISGGPVFS